MLAGLAWPLAGLRGLPWLGRTLRISPAGARGSAARTALWSVLGVVVFGLLFASADALFAEWVGAVVPDLGRTTLCSARSSPWSSAASCWPAATSRSTRPRSIAAAAARPVARRFEWLAPVLLVDAVFVVFLVAQAR